MGRVKPIVAGLTLAVLVCAAVAVFRMPPPADVVFAQIREADHAGLRASVRSEPGLVGWHDSLGYTPLHWAAAMSDRTAAEVLLAAGADVQARDDRGRTPLHVAAMSHTGGGDALVEMLLARGAAIDATDNKGATPLQLAQTVGQLKSAQVLVAAGAKPAIDRGNPQDTAVAAAPAESEESRRVDDDDDDRSTRVIRRWAWRAAGGRPAWVRFNAVRRHTADVRGGDGNES